MTSIPTYLGPMPSLANYLTNNGSNASTTGITPINRYGSGAPDLATLLGANESGGDMVTFSAQAQQLLAQGVNAPSAEDSDSTKAAAQDFVASFFDDSGVDPSTVSEQTLSLFQGLAGMISDMESVTRNNTLDDMAKNYTKGQRQTFTLQGQGETLSFAIQYASGKPVSMTVNDIKGSNAETAVISFTNDADGKPSGINVTSAQKTYNSFGSVTGSVKGDPLSFELYA